MQWSGCEKCELRSQRRSRSRDFSTLIELLFGNPGARKMYRWVIWRYGFVPEKDDANPCPRFGGLNSLFKDLWKFLNLHSRRPRQEPLDGNLFRDRLLHDFRMSRSVIPGQIGVVNERKGEKSFLPS